MGKDLISSPRAVESLEDLELGSDMIRFVLWGDPPGWLLDGMYFGVICGTQTP